MAFSDTPLALLGTPSLVIFYTKTQKDDAGSITQKILWLRSGGVQVFLC
jgi:hypothetical protein